jgi:hypothetical protein
MSSSILKKRIGIYADMEANERALAPTTESTNTEKQINISQPIKKISQGFDSTEIEKAEIEDDLKILRNFDGNTEGNYRLNVGGNYNDNNSNANLYDNSNDDDSMLPRIIADPTNEQIEELKTSSNSKSTVKVEKWMKVRKDTNGPRVGSDFQAIL